MSTRERAQELLTDLAGPDAVLREDQWTAIEALVVHHRRALVVQRTGWGKSAVYFIAARLLREQGLGPTVIVSPLLALMRNQVAAAERAGVTAATINSGNVTEWDDVHARVAAGELDVLLVSPERLNNPDFRDQVLPSLSADAGLVVVDEAHCVSDWGHDFRPDYRRIRSLIAELREGVPVLATTATANDRVVEDVAAQLGVGGADTTVLRGGLQRESLHLSVVTIPDPTARIAWLADHLETLPGSGIVYSLTVAGANDLAALLRDRGMEVAAYTGQTDPTEREAAEQDLLQNRVKALVATSALGMGFDKPDLGFVVHVGAPSSPISYYQQVGRAGRATERADVVLLPGPEDREIWSYFASVAFPREHVVRRVLEVLDTERAQSTQALEPLVELGRTRLEMVLKVLDVDGAVRRVKGGWLGTGEHWHYDRERYERLDEARLSEQRAMIEYQSTDECRMAFLRRQLDDPSLTGDAEADRCGRCDNCTGQHLSADVSADHVESTRRRLDRPGLDLAIRKQWPTGLKKVGVELSGKITDGPETGRILGRLTDPVWGPRLRALTDGEDGPAPDGLEAACIKVLAEWTWDERPTGLMVMESDSRPALLNDLGERLARVGRLEPLGVLHRRPDARPVSGANSAFRVASLVDAFEAPDLTAHRGPVLLLDLSTDTGWTLTVAARALRQAGADAVLPFALIGRG
ncbi:ATP-dependent DNA helicase RecQ [Rhodococcus sp. BP-241]|uniref:RecQ family ATP-dependent DNA helicase n=1 Tax=unclassified Rhodococcus (in: high G+C Gram-positive bacteria) TaxID=192944 RepID=UPI0006F4F6D1|nr:MULTISPECIES: RecQ family ATP-dependent DNA helicase [unclassified Rhodococcus (in: high G+C Gram-positive bacteria)]KQU30415.1 recombinase RecQ [Rhodococcus sp. Leaf225]KQU44680.1 recombinase RecQ [Rhodococcus sp. Leaf258]MBY6708382.1 ATP-dependent DNA helicase RecQ [Rhodococcus sp. BP-241]